MVDGCILWEVGENRWEWVTFPFFLLIVMFASYFTCFFFVKRNENRSVSKMIWILYFFLCFFAIFDQNLSKKLHKLRQKRQKIFYSFKKRVRHLQINANFINFSFYLTLKKQRKLYLFIFLLYFFFLMYDDDALHTYKKAWLIYLIIILFF